MAYYSPDVRLVMDQTQWKEGNVLFNDTLNTFSNLMSTSLNKTVIYKTKS